MATSRAQLIESLRLQQELDQREIVRKCEKSCWFWLTTQTETFDEHAKKKSVDIYKPFPQKEYLRHMLDLIANPKEERVFVAKSREMMMSWLVAGYITWECQFSAHTGWIIQSENEKKAGKILSYCKCLYSRQPQWLKKKYPLHGGKFETDAGRQSILYQLWEHGSSIEGVPAGPDQVRSGHPSGVFFDEACFIDGFEAAYASAGQVTPKIIAISSAVPGGYFAQVADDSMSHT